MKTKIKRTVATLLTATMLLTGLTACKTIEDIKEDRLVSAFSKDTDIEFEMVVYAVRPKTSGHKQIIIYGYNKQEDVEDESEIKERYMQANYNVSDEDYAKFKEVFEDTEVVYPFSNEGNTYLRSIIKKYEPVEVKTGEIAVWAYEEFDEIVEEHYAS